MVLIQRRDNGAWAIPGGMVDDGEAVHQTLSRELFEETGLKLDFSEALFVYQGVVDDPRNTDNAWMETTARALLLSEKEGAGHEPAPGDDAASAEWVLLTDAVLLDLYANHAMMVRMALEIL
jgi:ADP-ribose pyrophosphatase